MQNGIIFFSTVRPTAEDHHEENPDGQFYLWSPLMIFSVVMACVVGFILLILILYSLFYYCVYGTFCCPGLSCWWCPQQPQEDPVKVRIHRADSCRSSIRSSHSCDSCHSCDH